MLFDLVKIFKMQSNSLQLVYKSCPSENVLFVPVFPGLLTESGTEEAINE